MAAYNTSIMPPENAWFKLIQTNTDSGNYTKAMTTPAKGYDNPCQRLWQPLPKAMTIIFYST